MSETTGAPSHRLSAADPTGPPEVVFRRMTPGQRTALLTVMPIVGVALSLVIGFAIGQHSSSGAALVAGLLVAAWFLGLTLRLSRTDTVMTGTVIRMQSTFGERTVDLRTATRMKIRRIPTQNGVTRWFYAWGDGRPVFIMLRGQFQSIRPAQATALADTLDSLGTDRGHEMADAVRDHGGLGRAYL